MIHLGNSQKFSDRPVTGSGAHSLSSTPSECTTPGRIGTITWWIRTSTIFIRSASGCAVTITAQLRDHVEVPVAVQ